MDLLAGAAVTAVDNVVYNLAARLFQSKSTKRLALGPATNARAADAIPLINLRFFLIAVIALKLKGKLPWLFTPKVTIVVLLSAASLGWFLHPHTVN